MVQLTVSGSQPIEVGSHQTLRDLLNTQPEWQKQRPLAALVDGVLLDLSTPIDGATTVEWITAEDPRGLEVIRHSTAHLLAHAIKQLYPSAQITIGPVIEDGFYYDIAFERSFTPDDLTLIEERMRALAKQNIPVVRGEMSRTEAIEHFKQQGEHYKAEIISEIPEGQVISVYRQAEFMDLCRGPHVPSTGALGAFKLTKLAGAYWRGDSSKPMLQRIYGTAWATLEALQAYLHRLEEAEKRDHRKLAVVQDLFHVQEEGPGMVFWHPNGWAIYQTIEQYIRHKIAGNGYREVRTPQIVDRRLWERSGHWDKYRDMMFTTSSEKRDFAIKPMNCPCHIEIFKQGLKSYRDLPLRLAEFGTCHRNEPSGTLHGLMRVRQFVQDDAHIFCTLEQMAEEMSRFIDLTFEVYRDFGFEEVLLKFSTRPAQRVGSDEQWDKAEQAVEDVLRAKGLSFELQPGEGAFYGPKIEFSLKDCLGRVWQCGTLQVDFCLPERLDASYIGVDGQKHVPVMLHRAILGSMERWIGILTEHYAGLFPLWLAPVQVVVMGIAERHNEFVNQVVAQARAAGVRAHADLRNEKIGFKIREHTLAKVPYLLVAGDKEIAAHSVSVRTVQGQDQGACSVDEAVAHLIQEIKQRSRTT